MRNKSFLHGLIKTYTWRLFISEKSAAYTMKVSYRIIWQVRVFLISIKKLWKFECLFPITLSFLSFESLGVGWAGELLSFLLCTKTKAKGLSSVLGGKIQIITTSCWMFRIIHKRFYHRDTFTKVWFFWKMIASAIVLLLIYLSLIAKRFFGKSY